VRPSVPSPKQLSEPIPDAAGLEPSAEGPTGTVEYATSGKSPAGRRSWADQPVSIKLIMALALPALVEQVMSAAIGFTDTIVAGHTVPPGHMGSADDARAASAAAVGAMNYLQWFAGLMTATLGVGATAIVARSIGARRPRVANRVAGTASTAAFGIGILVAVLLYVLAHPLAWVFSLHGDAEVYAVQYVRIMCWTVCFQTAGQIGMACLRGAGDTWRPMIVTGAIMVINGVASPALSFGWFGLPAMGVQGNALGTLMAFAAAGIVTFAFLFYGDAGLKLRLSHLKIVPHLLMRISRIGVPSFAEGMMLWGGQLAVVMLVMGRVDKALPHAVSGTTMAAHNSTLRIESLAFLPGYGFAIACSALVGQYLGAGKPQEAERAGVLCTRLAVMTMTLAAIPMVAVSHLLLGFMVDSREVVELGWVPLIIAGLAQPGFALAIVKSAALKGAGETVQPLWATIIGMGGRVVAVLAIMQVLGAMGHDEWGLIAVWVCIFLDLLYRGIAMEVVFRRGRWKLRQV
jgi:putative MATE family efflux protein